MNSRNSSNNALSRTSRWCKAAFLGAAFAWAGTAGAQVTVTAWLNKSFRPEEIAEPFRNADFPSFSFLHDRYYDDEVGLSLATIVGTEIY